MEAQIFTSGPKCRQSISNIEELYHNSNQIFEDQQRIHLKHLALFISRELKKKKEIQFISFHFILHFKAFNYYLFNYETKL